LFQSADYVQTENLVQGGYRYYIAYTNCKKKSLYKKPRAIHPGLSI